MKEKLLRLNNEKLIDIAKNYRRYNYDVEIKDLALEILKERGITEQDLKHISNERDHDINQLESLLSDYKKSVILTLSFYFISLLLGSLLTGQGFVFVTILYLLTIIIYLFFYVKTYIKYHDFFKKVDGEAFGALQQIGFFMLGLPFCIFTFPYSIKIMKDRIKDRY